uniref:Immunoglobulin V-set domain-containing protein n=1 Tax=Chrysemys picta bellii TaxID=8478 RepID=A0A8C3P4V4_CHRPI
MWQNLVFSIFCLFLLLIFPGMGSAYVEQPPFLTGARENPKTLQCTLKQSSCSWMYWYRQREGKELEGLFNSVGDGPATLTLDSPLLLGLQPMKAVNESSREVQQMEMERKRGRVWITSLQMYLHQGRQQTLTHQKSR